MPALKNTTWERFAQLVAEGKSAAAAFRVIRPKVALETAETKGPEMARRSQVKVRISELQEMVGEIATAKFSMSREEWLESFKRIAGKAEQTADFSAARACLREIGLALPDYYAPEKQEHSGALEIVITRQG